MADRIKELTTTRSNFYIIDNLNNKRINDKTIQLPNKKYLTKSYRGLGNYIILTEMIDSFLLLEYFEFKKIKILNLNDMYLEFINTLKSTTINIDKKILKAELNIDDINYNNIEEIKFYDYLIEKFNTKDVLNLLQNNLYSLKLILDATTASKNLKYITPTIITILNYITFLDKTGFCSEYQEIFN